MIMYIILHLKTTVLYKIIVNDTFQKHFDFVRKCTLSRVGPNGQKYL